MSVQAQRDISLHPLVLGGRCVTRRVTLAQDGARSTALALGTVMAYNPTTTYWEPWTDETATDGTAHPCGIIYQTVTAAALVAGVVTNVTMIISDCLLNEDLVTFENSLTKATIVNIPANLNKSAEQCLLAFGLVLVDTIEGTSYEAA